MGQALDLYSMDIMDLEVVCLLFTAWFCPRMNFIPHRPSKRAASRYHQIRQLGAWLEVCFWMPEQAPNGTVGVYGTGCEGGGVGQLHLHHLKYLKVRIDRELKVCVIVKLLDVVVMTDIRPSIFFIRVQVTETAV